MFRSSRFTPAPARRHTGRERPGTSPLLSALFFPACVLYHELLLRLFDQDAAFFSLALVPILFFSAAAGLLLYLLLDLLPWKTAARVLGGVFLGAGTVFFCVERGCRHMFGVYYGPTTVGGMAGDVMGDFGSTVFSVVLGILPFILLSLVPLVAFILLRQSVLPEEGCENPVRLILSAVLVACQLAAFLLSTLGPFHPYYTYDFTANVGIPHFGLLTSVRLELEYAVTGLPLPPLDQFVEDPVPSPTPDAEPSSPQEEDPSAPPEGFDTPEPSADPSPTPVEYGYNTMDIDFQALADGTSDETLKAMHEYFGSLTPSQQNQYTGMFRGKNLIFLTAEAFSPYVISQELTPTLYRLSHEGFVFTNYYQPDWTMSTCGGEFANTTGIIPNWMPEGIVTNAVVDNDMPLTLAHQFAALGYSVPAWHDHTYTYYGRDKYLTAFGYDYKGGRGGGLEIPSGYGWPESDLEMMEATADSYIDDYVENGTPFHAYYMTVSGHTEYNFAGGNDMSSKHREEAQAAYPNASEPVQAYIACNLELEAAMKYLVDKLEAAGIADDTLIVLGADHYPYALAEGDTDYYNELRGVEDTEMDTSRYRNTLIMWSAAIEEPVIVDTPCYSCDILPTICNLFGLEYDSRLYSGRDVFATNYEPDQYSNCMPLVVFANNKGQGNSWITAAGTYEASTRTFTPNEGIEVDEDYVSRVNRLVQAKVSYAKLIVQQDYYRTVFQQ